MSERESEKSVRCHFGSSRRPSGLRSVDIPTLSRSAFLSRRPAVLLFRWHKVPTMFRKMVGQAFLMAGLAAIAASSGCGSRGSVARDAGLQSPAVLQALLRQLPKKEQKAGHTPNAKVVHPSRGQSGKGLGRAQRQPAFQGFGGACRDAS